PHYLFVVACVTVVKRLLKRERGGLCRAFFDADLFDQQRPGHLIDVLAEAELVGEPGDGPSCCALATIEPRGLVATITVVAPGLRFVRIRPAPAEGAVLAEAQTRGRFARLRWVRIRELDLRSDLVVQELLGRAVSGHPAVLVVPVTFEEDISRGVEANQF